MPHYSIWKHEGGPSWHTKKTTFLEHFDSDYTIFEVAQKYASDGWSINVHNEYLAIVTNNDDPRIFYRVANIARNIHVYDMECPGTGKSYQQINLEKKHNIPLGQLVEVENGARLFVVEHHRDMDGTPLYALFIEPAADERPDIEILFAGHAEQDLKII